MKYALSLSMVAVVGLASCDSESSSPQKPKGSLQTQACLANSDCKSPATPVCVNHICAAAPTGGTAGVGEICTADSDCLTGLVCDKGKCDVSQVAAGAACKEDDDCGTGLICQNGACAPGVRPDGGPTGTGAACMTDADCGVGVDCLNGFCAAAGSTADGAVPACNDNGDCGPGFICASGVCVAGGSDGGAPATVDGGGRACGTGPSVTCNDPTDCTAPATCVSGKCVTACNDPTDCGAGYVCTSGRCALAPCDSGYTCVSNVCVPNGGGGPPASGCHPVVNELQATGASAADEWVEIFNPCNAATDPAEIDLTGWKLLYRSAGNNAGGSDTLELTFTQKIKAGGYLLIAGSGYTGTKDGSLSHGLAGTGGAVGLRDASGKLIDSVAYATLTTANNFTEKNPAPNPPAQNSIARLPNGVDTNDNSADFRVSAKPTPRAVNK
jgi:hypothetical protein